MQRLSILFVFFIGNYNSFSQKIDIATNQVVIRGSIFNLKVKVPVDTMILEVWDTHIGGSNSAEFSREYYKDDQDFHPRVYKSIIKNGHYSFTIPNIKNPVYCSMGLGRSKNGSLYNIFKYYLIEPGDDIKISIDSISTGTNDNIEVRNIEFSGKGSAKFSYKHDLSFRLQEFFKSHPNYILNLTGFSSLQPTDSAFWVKNARNIFDHSVEERTIPIKMLNNIKGRLSSTAYYILYLDGTTMFQSNQDLTYWYTMYFLDKAKVSYDKIVIKQKLRSLYLDSRIRFDEIPEKAKRYSISYPRYVVDSLHNLSYPKPYEYIKNHYRGLVREKILLEFYTKKSASGITDTDVTDIMDALSFIRDFKNAEYLSKLKARSLVGKPFYNFSLPDVNGKYHTLNDFRGKTIFMDFWYTGCGGCVMFNKNIVKPLEAELNDDSTVVFITVSIDDKLRFEQSLTTEIYTSSGARNVINLYTDNQKKNHPIILRNFIIGYPFPVVIDKNGICRAVNMMPRSRELILNIIENVKKTPMSQ